ncbi:hypothetical protein CHUAL_002233 [Chamberlinius hualienensis]
MKKHCKFTMRSSLCCLEYLVILLLYSRDVYGLRLIGIEIPTHTELDESTEIQCMFDMEGDELYSVKWYKDSAEFYRYLPKDNPPAQVYQVDGVQVDLEMSGENVVRLVNVNLQSSGHYRCEVSAEAPSFATVYEEGELTVIALPEDSPQITGANAKYHIGDQVHVNCTSYQSKPVAILDWTINAYKVPKEFLVEYPVLIDENLLETSTLGVHFEIKESDFISGIIKLKCSATIAPLYHETNEISINQYNFAAAVLESKETPSHVSVVGNEISSGLAPSLFPFWAFTTGLLFTSVIFTSDIWLVQTFLTGV